MNQKLLFFLLPLLFLNACEYSPTKVNYKDISVTNPDIQFLILNENDLNVMQGDVEISYIANLNGRESIKITVYLDNIRIYYSTDNFTGFVMHTRNYSNGDHILKFELLTTTNSGDLADITGYEAYRITQEYQVQINN